MPVSASPTSPEVRHDAECTPRAQTPQSRDSLMYHTIEFGEALTLDLEISRKQPLERLSVAKGARMRAQLRPHVLETESGPVEAADLFFEDGSAFRSVRFACFSFID